jgi:hypothetical protein
MPPAQLKPFNHFVVIWATTHTIQKQKSWSQLELVISKPLRFYNLYCLHQFLGGAASGEQPLIITDHWTKEESL